MHGPQELQLLKKASHLTHLFLPSKIPDMSAAAWGAAALQGSSKASGKRRADQGRLQGIEKEVQDLAAGDPLGSLAGFFLQADAT